jgi:outer membrane protein OmpA-like peptidoglycan-associated protein
MPRTFHALSALVVLTAAVSFAQAGDEWNTFPPKPAATSPAPTPTPTPATVSPPAAKPAPAPVVKPATATPAAVTPAARPSTSPAATAARPATTSAKLADDAGPAAAADDPNVKVISTKERFLPGTEPHSPSTWGNSFDATENGRVTVGQLGLSSGFVPSARMGPKGIVRVSLLGEYLNITNFPVQNAQDIRSAITFAASFQPFEWGEVFVGYGASANTNNRTAPNLIQALGDLTLGVKASREWVTGLHAGLDLRLLTFSGVGNQGIDRFAVGFRPTLLGTYDFRSLSKSVPVIFTMNLGFTFDSTGNLVTTQKLNASEEFALSVNRYNRFNFAMAVEVPLPVVTPFIEYGFGLPLGVASLTGPDGSAVAPTAAMAHTLGFGLKGTVVKDLTLLAGVNVGLARLVGLGVPATPPWNFYFGASFAIDPTQRGETKIVETIRERKVEIAKAPPPLRVQGVVTDAETKKPIAGAVIAVAGVKPSATSDKGEYQTLDLGADKVKVQVSRDGYKPTEREVAIEAGKPATLDVALEPDVKKAKFQVSATSAKKPVKATVLIKGPAGETRVDTADNATGPVENELPAGQYNVTASGEGFLSQTRDVQVTPGAVVPLTFDLQPAPKKSLVTIKDGKIEILQQVHFATGKAQILADSFNLLQQVVDAVVKNNVKRIKIEGHTDNRGDKAANQALSEARAKAVGEYLVAQGIDAQRVESVGYGDAKPIAPNLTARGRELNRRVEFIILEK